MGTPYALIMNRRDLDEFRVEDHLRKEGVSSRWEGRSPRERADRECSGSGRPWDRDGLRRAIARCYDRMFAPGLSGRREKEGRWLKNSEKAEQAASCIENFRLFQVIRVSVRV